MAKTSIGQLSELLLKRPIEAVHLCQQALQAHEDLPSPDVHHTLSLQRLMLQGDLLVSDLSAAARRLPSVLRLIDAVGCTRESTKATTLVARTVLVQGDRQRGMSLIAKAQSMAEELADDHLLADAFLATIYGNEAPSAYPGLLARTQDIIRMLEAKPDVHLAITAYQSAMLLVVEHGQLALAAIYAQRAYELAVQSGYTTLQCLSAPAYAGMEWRLFRPQRAIELCEEALELASELGLHGHTGMCHIQLANIYQGARRLPEAIEYYRKAAECGRIHGADHITASAHYGISVTSLKAEDCAGCIKAAKDGITVARRMNWTHMLSSFHRLMASGYRMAGDLDRARRELRVCFGMLAESTAIERFHIYAEQALQLESDGRMDAALIAKRNAAENAAICADIPVGYKFWLELGMLEQRLGNSSASIDAFIKAREASEHDVTSLFSAAISEMDIRRRAAKHDELRLSTMVAAQQRKLNELKKSIKKAFSGAEDRRDVADLLKSVRETPADVLDSSIEATFARMRPDFLRTLAESAPDLSPAERRLCTLLAMGMSTKDIAQTLSLTPGSVRTIRSRIRQKLQGLGDDRLEDYLLRLGSPH